MSQSQPPVERVNDLARLPVDTVRPSDIPELLRQRFLEDLHYTAIGGSVLVALNPFRATPWSDVSAHYVEEYKTMASSKANQWREPHLCQLVNHAYIHMRRTGLQQTIVFSGESGSGKSEQFRQATAHLNALGGNKKVTRIQQQVQQANVIVRCFSHAKTTTHDDASRMATYLELQFSERGRLIGSQWMAPYALEKSRVTQARQDERNFHVFYSMLAGASREEKAHLGLTDWSAFEYLARTNTSRASGIDDAQMYNDLRAAFKTLGFPKQTVTQIFQTLAAILHLGNLEFAEDPHNAQDAALIRNTHVLDMAAELLGVEPSALQSCLTFKSKMIKRDVITLFLDANQASRQRNHLAETLYVLLVSWITEQMNQKLSRDGHSCIGLIDIPGNGQPSTSSFDQLVYNSMNETSHHWLLSHLWEHNDKELDNEGITMPVSDGKVFNTPCLDALTHPAKGLYSVLNAQVGRTRAGDDQVWLEQWMSANQSDTVVTVHQQQFAIQHFWGSANYDAQGFMERNEDYLYLDFCNLFRGNAYNAPTTNSLLASMFAPRDNQHHRLYCPQQGIRPARLPGMLSIPSEKKDTTDTPMTVTAQLQRGIQDLTAVVSNTVVWFVLCMRPNELALPTSCDVKKVASQASLFKLAPMARRLRQDYNTVFMLEEFLERYAVSLPLTLDGQQMDTTLTLPRDKCVWITQALRWDETMAAVGRTKIFLSNAAFLMLENDLRSLEKSESKRSKLLGRGGVDAYDNCSFADDRMSTAVSDSEYIEGSVCAPHDCAGSDMFSQHTRNEPSPQDNNMLYEVKPDMETNDEPQMSKVRRRWLFVVWALTWWIPSVPCLTHFAHMKRKDIRIAWREKVALCILIFFMSSAMILFIVGFGPLLCPHQDVYSISELQDKSSKKAAYVAIRGEVFDLTKFAPHHWASEVIPDKAIFDYAGKDATNLFPVQVSALCDGTTGSVSDHVVLDFQYNLSDKNAAYHDFRYFTNDYRPDWYFEQMVYLRRNYRLGFMGYDPADIARQATNAVNVGELHTHRQWAILHGGVYDLTYYMMGGRAPRAPEGQTVPSNVDLNFMDNSIVELFRQLAGTDISKHFDALPLDPALRTRQLVCLRNLFFVGKVDTRRSVACQFSEYFLLIVTGILCATILFKFIAALQMTSRREPAHHDKFIVCQVPCYTESEESLRLTIDSIAGLDYDDKRKLLFLVCDGMIVGSGNDRPTPRIVLDILGVDPSVDPEPLSFLALGEGHKQHNMGKIYSGLYECSGHVVPYVVVVKVGHPSESQKPGNRGKRDSQMILMRFLNKVHFDAPMTPMELEIYHQIKNVIGVMPDMYEFVLMIDADTEVLPDSLSHMVSCFVHDSKIVGLCGETKLANERESWVTMIQVYEYYISHFLSKAFESLFGSVTCLPGCFCMYRIRSPSKDQPLLVSNQVIEDYAVNSVHTLHQKNLLHLGEDRYLTTLILKHFPTYKTKFTSDACCLTNAPERWSVLLSQRRRWINSTVHNLGELAFLPQLCGFCCFSMRFVVILDLMSTLTMPAVVLYLGFLIYRLVTETDQVPLISIILLCGVYGLQALIFILRRKWEHIGWMIIYLLAIPLFSFFVPIYAFWHFDDFSWGNTRIVVDVAGQKKAVPVDEGHFDPSTIPLKKWSEHESELWETGSIETKGTTITSNSRRTIGHPPSGMPMAPSFQQLPSLANFGMGLYNDAASSIMRYSAPMPMQAPIASPRAPSMYSQGSAYSHMPHVYGNPRLPSDEEIRAQVYRIVSTADLMTVTKKQVREQLAKHFNMDMSFKKDYINCCIEEALHQLEPLQCMS